MDTHTLTSHLWSGFFIDNPNGVAIFHQGKSQTQAGESSTNLKGGKWSMPDTFVGVKPKGSLTIRTGVEDILLCRDPGWGVHLKTT